MVSTKLDGRLKALVSNMPEGAGKYVALGFRIVRALAVNNISDRAMTLAGQAFTSVLPVMLLLTALHGVGATALDEFLGMFDLSDMIKPDESTATYTSFGIIGALMTVISATSLARALDRMYVGVWGFRSAGMRGWWRWFAVVVILAIAVLAQVVVAVYYDDSVPRGFFGLVSTFVIWTLAWVAVPRVLMKKQFPLVDLWCVGALCGAALTVFIAFTELGYSTVFASSRAAFGALGLVFASIGWLFIYTAIVVVATVLVKVLRTPDDNDATIVEQDVDLDGSVPLQSGGG
ncbi:hypothetical protein [Gordonia sp. (in: high G+C Gram-positive bacteria)]|uniref:hypothetical protein n=1 Tax=Gordonia sp. (in: high G+C Gram-positive bacteria) TaxID=84139 RepID=UPI003C730D8D